MFAQVLSRHDTPSARSHPPIFWNSFTSLRFGIRPGYRWDGVDRGNGWEDKIVAKSMNDKYKADLAHKWATADM